MSDNWIVAVGIGLGFRVASGEVGVWPAGGAFIGSAAATAAGAEIELTGGGLIAWSGEAGEWKEQSLGDESAEVLAGIFFWFITQSTITNFFPLNLVPYLVQSVSVVFTCPSPGLNDKYVIIVIARDEFSSLLPEAIFLWLIFLEQLLQNSFMSHLSLVMVILLHWKTDSGPEFLQSSHSHLGWNIWHKTHPWYAPLSSISWIYQASTPRYYLFFFKKLPSTNPWYHHLSTTHALLGRSHTSEIHYNSCTTTAAITRRVICFPFRLINFVNVCIIIFFAKHMTAYQSQQQKIIFDKKTGRIDPL